MVFLKIKAPYESEEMQKINNSMQHVGQTQKISNEHSRGSSFSGLKMLLESKNTSQAVGLDQSIDQEKLQ